MNGPKAPCPTSPILKITYHPLSKKHSESNNRLTTLLQVCKIRYLIFWLIQENIFFFNIFENYVHSVRGQSVFFNLALTEGNMLVKFDLKHGLRTPREEIAFTARPKIQSKIFRYSQSIFCLPHRPNFSDIFDLCLHWVSIVRGQA